MTNNEIKLLNIIRESENPDEVIEIAIDIILSYLEQPESFE